MKKFKHKKTGEIATYKDGVLKSSGFCVEIGVEPSSEFWEEVIEKDYLILTYNDSNYIKIIRSVKRLTDNEIFFIGDKVKTDGLSWDEIQTIQSFQTNSNGFFARLGREENSSFVTYKRLDELKKVKKLFTTQDGIDMYEGDKCWAGYLEEGIESFEFLDYEGTSKRMIYFSTKKAAKEYILMNKPCLSLNDVNYCMSVDHKEAEKRFRELAESKL